MLAAGPHCSRSDRSSLDVALEQVSRPLSVVVGLDMDDPALADGKLELFRQGSTKGTPPERETEWDRELMNICVRSD